MPFLDQVNFGLFLTFSFFFNTLGQKENFLGALDALSISYDT
jgi:hypothetical protein